MKKPPVNAAAPSVLDVDMDHIEEEPSNTDAFIIAASRGQQKLRALYQPAPLIAARQDLVDLARQGRNIFLLTV